MEPEPKRFTVRWRDGSYRVSDPTLPDEVHAYHADDPAIVQALAVRKACHEAGLLDEHGNLRKIIGTLPVTADGCVVGHGAKVWPRADLFIYNDPPNDDWTTDDEAEEVQFTLSGETDGWTPGECYSSYEAARSAAERAAKGDTDGH